MYSYVLFVFSPKAPTLSFGFIQMKWQFAVILQTESNNIESNLSSLIGFKYFIC